MKRMKHRGGSSPLPGASAAAIAVAVSALAAASCGFVGADMFPKELQYAEGGYDLAEEYGAEPASIGELRIEHLRAYDGSTGLFVAAKRPSGWHLSILDGGMGRAASLDDPNFSRFLGSYDGASSFVCGRTGISVGFTVGASGSMTSCDGSAFDIAASRYCVRFQDLPQGTGVYATEKASSVPLGSNSPTVMITGEYFDCMDSSLLHAGRADAKFFLLARSRSAGGSEAVAFGFPDSWSSLSSILDGSTSLNSSVSVVRVRADYVDQGWITDDGIVLVLHGSESRLARFDPKTGVELDSVRIDTEWMQGASFEDSGEFWYYYDRGSGYVKKLRTWWR
jgi:hypothetical protein